MPEIWKKNNVEMITTFFLKSSAKSTNFDVSSLGIFDEVPVSKFNQVSVSKVTVSTEPLI